MSAIGKKIQAATETLDCAGFKEALLEIVL